MDIAMVVVAGLVGLVTGCVLGAVVLARRDNPDADLVAERVAASLHARQSAGDARLDERLGAVSSGLGRVDAALRESERLRAVQQGELSSRLAQSVEATTRLSATAADLHRVLAGSASRGRLGERVAEDVLQAAGLIPGVHYVRQRRVDGGGVPDLTVLLPERRTVPIDVKFPLAAWWRAVEATDVGEAARHRRAFVRDVRARVDEVACRDYADGSRAVGFTLLFLPSETILAVVVEEDPALLDHALSAGVVVCSPLTLFAVLGVVREALDRTAVVEAAADIRSALTSLERRWARLTTDLDRLGTHLRNASRAHEDVTGAGRGAVEDAIDGLRRPLDSHVASSERVAPGDTPETHPSLTAADRRQTSGSAGSSKSVGR